MTSLLAAVFFDGQECGVRWNVGHCLVVSRVPGGSRQDQDADRECHHRRGGIVAAVVAVRGREHTRQPWRRGAVPRACRNRGKAVPRAPLACTTQQGPRSCRPSGGDGANTTASSTARAGAGMSSSRRSRPAVSRAHSPGRSCTPLTSSRRGCSPCPTIAASASRAWHGSGRTLYGGTCGGGCTAGSG